MNRKGDKGMKWQDKLTKAELRHLRVDAGCRTLADLKACREGQKKLDPTKEVCFLCRPECKRGH
jgi:hypothetical protein